eukprot:4069641-Amphidinium_carterae.1
MVISWRRKQKYCICKRVLARKMELSGFSFLSLLTVPVRTVPSQVRRVGVGGPGLRANYTALDRAELYHRREIEVALREASAP